jgi:hypothetical protein
MRPRQKLRAIIFSTAIGSVLPSFASDPSVPPSQKPDQGRVVDSEHNIFDCDAAPGLMDTADLDTSELPSVVLSGAISWIQSRVDSEYAPGAGAFLRLDGGRHKIGLQLAVGPSTSSDYRVYLIDDTAEPIQTAMGTLPRNLPVQFSVSVNTSAQVTVSVGELSETRQLHNVKASGVMLGCDTGEFLFSGIDIRPF